MKLLRTMIVAAPMACAVLAAIALLPSPPCHAGAIPAWLDDGIAQWNKVNPANPMTFVDIKDAFVWYTMVGSPSLSAKEIRDKAYAIAYNSGYQNMQDEELVTTGRPPSTKGGPVTDKKCWTRSFLRDIQRGSDTTVQRMLSTMVCQDGPNWAVGFRTAQ